MGDQATETDGLAEWLQQWVKDHGATDFRDDGHVLVMVCACGADLGVRYGPTDIGIGREAEAAYYFRHQATDLRAAFSIALPPGATP